jgi:HSP20 family molecular chaperone IbpA
MAESKELLAKEKQELATRGEQMQPGLVFTPPVDIFETDREITVLADMPGVSADGIKIDLQNDVLTISGDVKPWEDAGESDVLVEFEIGKYYRQFTLSEIIDQNKIEAGLENGVLRLNLPKSEKALPRQIAVKTG